MIALKVEQTMSMILRSATKSDAAYLLNLEEICMRAYAEALSGDWKQSDTVESLDALLTIVLFIGERVIEPMALGHLWIGVNDLDRCQQMSDFRSCQTEVGISQRIRDCVKASLSSFPFVLVWPFLAMSSTSMSARTPVKARSRGCQPPGAPRHNGRGSHQHRLGLSDPS
ncbi:hypothetical protein [Phyllobacterium salinisoli]|uniref:hypothetical protein n=1 Tax=Phyllobacterium salinisoli TaxID=1899321 RepID=UPI00190F1D75|nr:hypothetical protein [Phyllobacterium salinisoli]